MVTLKEAVAFSLYTIKDDRPDNQIKSDIIVEDGSMWMFFPNEDHCQLSLSVDVSDPDNSEVVITMWDDYSVDLYGYQDYTDIEMEHVCDDVNEAKSIFDQWYDYLKGVDRL